MKKIPNRIISILLVIIICFNYAPTRIENVSAATVYNPAKAVAYARQYALNYNSAFYNYAPEGGDCANFVSQCLAEGGLAPNNSWGVYEQGGKLKGNAAWTGAISLLNYFMNSAEFKNLVVANPSRSEMKAGNPMWMTRGHVVICTADGGTYCAHTDDAKDHAPMDMLYTVRLDKLANQNHDPVGCFDIVSSDSSQKLFVRGWAFDPDNPSASIDVHVYIGGEAGTADVETYAVKADGVRDDVNKAYGITGKHGFSTTLTVKKSGSQKIAIYAIDSAGGNNPRIGDVKTVNIIKDTENPKISNAKIYNVTSDGYDVSFDVSDNVGVTKVECPTWTDKGEQDDLIWHQATLKNGTATCHIKRSDHNNEYGTYITHVYAWDNQKNHTAQALSTKLIDPASIVKMQSIELSKVSSGDKNIYEGDSFKIAANIIPSNTTDKSLVWKSSDESIVTVDNNGNAIVAPSVGGKRQTVSITATSKDNSVTNKISVSVFPKTGYCNEEKTVSFNINLDESTMTISGNGKMVLNENPWLLNYDIKKVIIGYGVTNIPDGMFIKTSVNEVVIPESVVEIGANVFTMMSGNIDSLTIPSSVKKMSGLALQTGSVKKVIFKSNAPELYGDNIIITPEIHVPCDATGYENWPAKIIYDQPAISDESDNSNKTNKNDFTKSGKTDSQKNYSNEWVDGKWYDADGKQSYSGTLQWKNNATGWWIEDTTGWYPRNLWQKIDGVWYYFKSDGYMASNEYYNGYWFNQDGSWASQYYLTWKSNATGWWIEDISGWWPSSSWLKIDGNWYYFDGSGYMVTNSYIDGWWIGADGVCR